MNKYWEHFKTITKHKWYVGIECFKRGLYWQGITHDLSKYSPTEFLESAKFFRGNGSPISVAKKINGYSIAWLHHKGHNKHHWEYYTDFKYGEVYTTKIPYRYIVEMCCDMIGASKAYLKEEYNREKPLEYFDSHCDKWIMDGESLEELRNMLVDVSMGWER